MKEFQNFYTQLDEIKQVIIKFSLIVTIFLCAAFVEAHASLIFNF